MLDISATFCSRSFHPIRCDFVAAFSERTVAAASVQWVMMFQRIQYASLAQLRRPAARHRFKSRTRNTRFLRLVERAIPRLDHLFQSPLVRHPTDSTLRRTQLSDLAKWAILREGGEVKPNYLNLDRDFAVDELAVVYPILNAIFDPIPIVAEEADSFVCGRIG